MKVTAGEKGTPLIGSQEGALSMQVEDVTMTVSQLF